MSTGTLETPVGRIHVTASAEALIRVEWRAADGPAGSTPSGPETTGEPGTAEESSAGGGDELLVEALDQLRAYFSGRLRRFSLPIDFGPVSAVARRVLTTLDEAVDYGTTVTYGGLAELSGTGIPARSVGGIMGLNPLPLIVPCHRVVAGDGLGGYSGGPRGQGLETKRCLLEMEGALPRPLF